MTGTKLFLFLLGFLFHPGSPVKEAKAYHPFFVTVTEIEENQKEKTLEITCKIFTDDFEKALRMHHSGKIDLLNPPSKTEMNKLVNDYITGHLKISVDGVAFPLQFIGYEKNDEAVVCYFQANQIAVKKTVSVFNNLLFEYKPEQANIVHVTVRGKRKSRQLSNPDANLSFEF